VPQDSSASLNPALRIGTQLMEILEAHDFGSEAERRARLTQMMEEVLLPSDRAFLRRYPHQLSGGQQQRVAIARALVNDPKILLADEPTGALDTRTSEEIMKLFCDLNQRGITVIIVTHENDIAAFAKRKITFRDGRIVEDVRQPGYAARPRAATRTTEAKP
jgi:ABC-type glutathione transport system ATPase component